MGSRSMKKFWITFDVNNNWTEMVEAASFAEACKIASERIIDYNLGARLSSQEVSITKIEEE